MANTDLDIKDKVREHYAGVAKGDSDCCANEASCGCNTSEQIGYSKEELASVPQDAEMGLGCGTPVVIAHLQPGETVIGWDMTSEMLSKARKNAEKGGYRNVEFRLGEIENLPVADNVADAVISNCVINLSPNKSQVYKEAYRVLKPGGRFAVSDMVSLAPLPERLKNDVASYTGCIAGTVPAQQIETWLGEAGFERIDIQTKKKSSEFIQGGAETL